MYEITMCVFLLICVFSWLFNFVRKLSIEKKPGMTQGRERTGNRIYDERL